MIGIITGLTLKQLVGQRRSVLVVLLAAIPVLVGLAVRLTQDGGDNPQEGVANGLLGGFVVQFVLPLTALIFGTAALGQEFEEGTSVYLLARPTPRWQIVAGKLLGAWIATSAVVVGSTVAASLVVLAGEDQLASIMGAFALATIVGGLGYVSLFLCLSVATGRALVIGMVYVFLWEATFTSFAPGTQYLSIREYTLSLAEALAGLPTGDFDAPLETAPAVVLLTILIVGAITVAVRRLQRYQITSAAS